MKRLSQTYWRFIFPLLIAWLFSPLTPVWSHSLPYSPSVSQQVKPSEIPDIVNTRELTSIHPIIEKGDYKVIANKQGGYNSSNPQHGFRIVHSANGSTYLKPYEAANNDYHISFRLQGVGYTSIKPLYKPQSLQAETMELGGSKLTYHWSDHLTEWWVNNKQGVEQWFQLQKAPDGRIANEPLRLRMDIATDMAFSVKDARFC